MAELFNQTAAVDIKPVVYGWDSPALSKVIAGEVPIIFSPPEPSALSALKQGQVKVLMQTGPARLTAFPTVPTAAEVGLPDATLTMWGGFWAPAGTPTAIVVRLAAELGKVLSSEEFRKMMAELGSESYAYTPKEFATFINTERQKWALIIKKLGVAASQ